MMRNALPAVLLVLCATAAAANDVEIARGIVLPLPDRWKAEVRARNSVNLLHASNAGAKTVDANATVYFEARRDHADALRRLAAIETEHATRVTWRVIGGWPALERVLSAPVPHRGQVERGRSADDPGETSLRVTTAVAAGDALVRIQTLLRSDTDRAVAEEALNLGRKLKLPPGDAAKAERELVELRSGALRPKPLRTKPYVGPTRRGGAGGTPVNGAGEIEIAASLDGKNVVTNAACSSMFSTDGGSSWTVSQFTGLPAGAWDGDCVVTWGQSGNFYRGLLGNTMVGIYTSASPDNGANFTYTTLAVNRTAANINVDQPHLAADRWNKSASNKDRVYVTWHEGAAFDPRVACSKNGGATWGSPVTANGANVSFPRVSVGPDGAVYVVSRNLSNVVIDKYTDCDAGLSEMAGWPVSFAINDVVCPVAGLDRCNDGNTLSSPTLAVDDLDAKHVFLAWAQNTGANNEDIVIADSTDGGQSFGTPVTVSNTAVTGRRFLPWISAWGGNAYVAWYGRDITSTKNDLTRYFYAGAGGTYGSLHVTTPETDISGSDDPQCAKYWPCGARSLQDATVCTIQPQGAAQGNGCPKYGDYNGSAAGGGRFFTIWASATAPAGSTFVPDGTIHAFTAAYDVPSDYYVRDWTNDSTHHDNGQEPSTHDQFYVTSDVWNQQTAAPDALVNDWVIGSQAAKGMSGAGDNFAFARVSRRASAAATMPNTDVTLHFLVSDFGAGMPFADAGADADPKVTFLPGDTTQTLQTGYPWHLDTGASKHVCLAVEISAPNDLGLPTLAGTSPGATLGDPIVLADNNKAQRNLDTFLGTGMPGPMPHAIIHNDGLRKESIRVVFEVQPRTMERIKDATIRVVGGRVQPLRARGEFVLPDVEPGENRWIGIDFGSFHANPGELLPVAFNVFRGTKLINGFAIAARTAPLPAVIDQELRDHVAVFTRIARGSGEANDAARSDPTQYASFMASHVASMSAVVGQWVTSSDPTDSFGVMPALLVLRDAAHSGNVESIAAAHAGLLDRLDAAITRVQKSNGDPNDVLHNVQWERSLAEKVGHDGAAIVNEASSFIHDWQARKIGRDAFPAFVSRTMDPLERIASSKSPKLLPLVQRLRDARSAGGLGALQKAHRELLAALSYLLE
jgi:hypothetical protein